MSGKYIIKKWFDGMWMLYAPGREGALCASFSMAIRVMDNHAAFGTFDQTDPDKFMAKYRDAFPSDPPC